jgi:hypothetical protein
MGETAKNRLAFFASEFFAGAVAARASGCKSRLL